MLPFSKVFRQGVVGFFRHDVFFHLVIVLDFLEDGSWVEIGDADDHSGLNSVEVKSSHILFHLGEDVALFALEGESNIWRLGSISLLDVFFEGEDCALRVDSQLGDFE